MSRLPVAVRAESGYVFRGNGAASPKIAPAATAADARRAARPRPPTSTEPPMTTAPHSPRPRSACTVIRGAHVLTLDDEGRVKTQLSQGAHEAAQLEPYYRAMLARSLQHPVKMRRHLYGD